MADDVTKNKVVISDMKTNNTENESEQTTVGSKKSRKKLILLILGAILLIAAIASSVFFYMKYQDVKMNPSEAITQKNTEETVRVLDKLKAVLLVAETEAPTVARVEDPEKLKTSNQEFYKDILQGDYLIIFPKRAIIFRESENRLINIAPIINASELKTPEPTTIKTPEED